MYATRRSWRLTGKPEVIQPAWFVVRVIGRFKLPPGGVLPLVVGGCG
jgi:hypothetical protein